MTNLRARCSKSNHPRSSYTNQICKWILSREDEENSCHDDELLYRYSDGDGGNKHAELGKHMLNTLYTGY